MADTSKITLGQLKTALTQAKNYTDNEIAGVTGVSKVEPETSDMPKVFFYGNALPTTKDNVNLTMDYVSNTAKFSSFVKLKCQGTSSMNYAKKNFTVAMYSDEARATKLKKDFKGWGAQSKFCLKANYVDTTHTRNVSGARIAYDMVQSRPDSPFKQQLLQCPRNGAVDGFPIKLYFNGEFYGIYTWNIPKDDWMFNMDKTNPNHVVLCAERNTDGNSSLINSCQFRKLWTDGDGGDWSVEVGTYSTEMVASFNRCINFVMTATDQEFHDNIGQYFDLYSLLDYYCFSYLTCHLDGLAKNMLMATYDGVIWGACLYDMDSIYGVNWNGNSYVAANYQCPEQYQEQFSALWPRIERCFSTELYARYRELRQGALSLSNIIKHVEEIYDVIPDRVFADEKAKWANLPQVSTNTMTRFRNYMRDRAVYVDAQMKEIGTRVPCTGIVLSTDTLSFTTADTQTLSVVISPENCTDTVTWSVSPADVATVDNGLVTPLSNGRCTITATCGSYSDTCAVTVNMSTSVGCTSISLDKTELNLGTNSVLSVNYVPGFLSRSNYGYNKGVPFGGIISTTSDYTTDFISLTGINSLTAASTAKTSFGAICYDKDKTAKYVLNYYNGNYIWRTKDTNNEGQLTISQQSLTLNTFPEGAAYIRICVSTNPENVTITSSGVAQSQLTATITPATCAEPVVWSVSPEGIVTVDNGLVTAVANGEATITATCGSKSATCVVTVSGMSESGGDSGENANYLANASWQAGTLDITNNATVSGSIDNGSTYDRYASVQIPAGKYALRSATATYKKYRLNDSKGNVIYYNSGANSTSDLIIDTSISDDTIFTLEVSYYKPNDTIEVPSLTATDETNVVTLTLDGSLSYAIPNWPGNPSGENGQINVEYILSGINKVPAFHILKGYTLNNSLNSTPSKGLAKQYNVSVWLNIIYLSFTLDMAETGVTNDVESITNYLSNNPLTFKYVI